jgi:hypothetical protein
MAEVADALAFIVYDQDSGIHIDMITDLPAPTPSKFKVEEHEPSARDRDSGIFLDDTEGTLPPTSTPPTSRPTSIASSHSLPTLPPSRPASISFPFTSVHTSCSSLSRTNSDATVRRFRRPAELNLSISGPASAKPKSELEQRYALIRNSQTQYKAALKSPTQLLKDRLNLTPSKEKHEKVRVFTPPQPMLNGCILPGPAARMAAFLGSNVRARTEKDGRPAWWCKFDKLVVFDGVVEGVTGDPEHGGMKFCTRSSKGLSIARRRGDTESVVMPLECEHCQDMLRRSEWKYDVQVCKRGVCWECRERCRWEVKNPLDRAGNAENVEKILGVDVVRAEERNEANRERADSVLQGQEIGEEELMAKVGIETGPRSPIEAMSGIAERLSITDGLEIVQGIE